MEYNQPSAIVKDLHFGENGNSKIMAGVEKLANAVKSTLGASGKCVIYEDAQGKPVITKDGVTVAESVVLLDPVENIGATLIKEAAKNTVKEAGDGTTTATVLAYSLLKEALPHIQNGDLRTIKNGIASGTEKVIKYLDKIKKDVSGDMLHGVAAISTNNDKALGDIIANAYESVGKNGVVLMEESESEETYFETVKGAQIESGLKSHHLITDNEKGTAELDNPYVLIVTSPIANIRKILPVLEHVLQERRSLLIVATVEAQPMSALITNKLKGEIKVNIIDVPGFGSTKQDTIDDLAILTGAKVINEELGDDMDLIDASVLGVAIKSVTNSKNTVLTVESSPEELEMRIKSVEDKMEKETNPYMKKKLEQRLAMLAGAVGIIKVGAQSEVELKEKKDRVEDAIYAVKAALQEGIVPGGGVALRDAAEKLDPLNVGEAILHEAILAPYETILSNAGILLNEHVEFKRGRGINVVDGRECAMINKGIIDPVLVTKTALKNAASVVSTIISADCIISNKRVGDASY